MVLNTDLKSLCLKDVLFKKTRFVIAKDIGKAIEKVVSSKMNSSRRKNTEHKRNMRPTALPFESLNRLLNMVLNRTLYDKKSNTKRAINPYE